MTLPTTGKVPSKVSPTKTDTVPVGVRAARPGISTTASSKDSSPATNEL
jgi:hypothetical protein